MKTNSKHFYFFRTNKERFCEENILLSKQESFFKFVRTEQEIFLLIG